MRGMITHPYFTYYDSVWVAGVTVVLARTTDPIKIAPIHNPVILKLLPQ